jgi:hypothetical protein
MIFLFFFESVPVHGLQELTLHKLPNVPTVVLKLDLELVLAAGAKANPNHPAFHPAILDATELHQIAKIQVHGVLQLALVRLLNLLEGGIVVEASLTLIASAI